MPASIVLAVIALTLSLCAITPTANADALILKDGRKIPGKKIVYMRGDKEYVLLTGSARMSYPETDVRAVIVKQPAGIKKAQTAIDREDYSAAVRILDKVIKDYHKLSWDKRAKPLLARAYFGAGDTRKAVRMCEEIFDDPDIRPPPALSRLYLNALIEERDYEKVETQIVKLIGTGSRGTAAAAQVLRGDMLVEQEKHEDALIRGYLRTVELYRDVKAIQPEALHKTIACFQKLGENDEAKRFKKRLLEKYPNSMYAAKHK